MSSRLVAAAQIRRAAIAARRALEEMRRGRVAWLQRQYEQLATTLRTALERAAGGAATVPIHALGPLRREAEHGAGSLAMRLQAELDRALGIAVQTGAAGVGAAISGDAREVAVQRTLGWLREFVGADGLNISDRIWRVRDGTRQVLTRALEQAITEGWSGIEAAQRLIGQGLAVTPEIRRAIAAAGLDSVADLISRVLLRNTGNPLANANRLMTTEINRAYTESFVEGLAENDEVAGVRYLLSPRHPRVDICDMLASVNLHGMGPGVYPLKQHPYPAHPQTLCYLEAVFHDEITDEDRAGKQTRSDWLRGQPAHIQNAILGLAKGDAFRAGHIPEFGIRTPWAVHKERLARRGIDVEAFGKVAPPASAPAPPKPVVAPSLTPTLPVSAALDVLVHRQRVNATLAIIDTVHSDGTLPRLPVRASNAAAYGSYTRTLSGQAVQISLRRSHVLEHAFTHELGHFLDHQALGDRGTYASVAHPLLSAWRTAVQNSAAVAGWKLDLAAARAAGDRVHAQYVDYLLLPYELWARTYAQYIALRSNDSALMAQLTGTDMGGMHWSWTDFEPIARAIDALLRSKGWKP